MNENDSVNVDDNSVMSHCDVSPNRKKQCTGGPVCPPLLYCDNNFNGNDNFNDNSGTSHRSVS